MDVYNTWINVWHGERPEARHNCPRAALQLKQSPNEFRVEVVDIKSRASQPEIAWKLRDR